MSKSNDQVWLFRRACYERFEFFTKFLVSVLKPHRGFEWNWHHEVIADRLGQCVDGPVQRLVINQPPRSAKSTFASVAFPLWCLLRDPSREILCISYGEELGRQFTEESRTFVQNRRVQALFPGVWRIGKRNGEILGSKGGRRYPVSAGGAITGRGADLIIIDDPLKASEAHQKARDNINDWYDANIYQRLNNKNTGCFVLVMQRLHERDLSNHIMTGVGRIDRLILPSIASTDETWELSNSRIFSRPAGASLQEDRESLSRLKEVREAIGGYNFMAQYQQQPASHEEAIIKEDWFQGYFDWEIEVPRGHSRFFSRIIQAWDTAIKADEVSDYSACVTIGEHNGKYYILDVYRGKLAFPDLMRKVEEKCEEFRPQTVIVEDAASGQSLIQALRGKRMSIKSVKPNGSKFVRLNGISGVVESGNVLLPHGHKPWKDDFLLEITRFPNTRHDDQVDAFAYAIDFLREKPGWIYGGLAR